MITRIFKHFGLLFGRAFTSQIEDEIYRRELVLKWSESLAGMRLDNIAFGLKKLTHSAKIFAPGIPEFIALCKPTAEDLDLPDAIESYQVIISRLHVRQEINQSIKDFLIQKYKHPFNRVVANQCDRLILNTMRSKDAMNHVGKAHKKALNLIIQEPDLLNWPVASLEKTKPDRAAVKTSPPVAIAQMRKLLK